MATARTKKTIKFNPLSATEPAQSKRTGLLVGLAGEAGPVRKKVNKQSVTDTPSVQKKVKRQTVKAPNSSLEASDKPAPIQNIEAVAAKVDTKRRAARKKPIAKDIKAPEAAEIPQASPPDTPSGNENKTESTAGVDNSAGAEKNQTQSKGNSVFGWIHRKAQVRYFDGKLFSAHEIVRSPLEDVYGFYEAKGSFVSLMHLEGPIDQANTKFLPLAFAGFVMGGPLGLFAASLLSLRRQNIFLARQPAGDDRYVSLDSNGIALLKRVAPVSAPKGAA